MSSERRKEMKALGAAIRRGRQALELSQEDFAEISDVHRTYIGQLERGEKNVSFISLLKVASALRSTPSRLLKDAGM